MVEKKPFDLLIIFTDGEKKVIFSVDGYRLSDDNSFFSFERNGYRSFIPKENIKFFGRKIDWEGL